MVDAFHVAFVVCDTAKVRVFKQITTRSFLRFTTKCCLRYCKSTSFQANHNLFGSLKLVRLLFAILQKYEFSSKSQLYAPSFFWGAVVCDTAKVRVFKQITTMWLINNTTGSCLRYCKSTSFQANHNLSLISPTLRCVVCDTAKVRVFKQITTRDHNYQLAERCLRYCKSTSFQANHNKVRERLNHVQLFAILQKYEFSSKSQHHAFEGSFTIVVCDTAKVRVFKQITTHFSAQGFS